VPLLHVIKQNAYVISDNKDTIFLLFFNKLSKA